MIALAIPDEENHTVVLVFDDEDQLRQLSALLRTQSEPAEPSAVCAVCGERFTAKRSDHRYCSKHCRYIARRRKQA